MLQHATSCSLAAIDIVRYNGEMIRRFLRMWLDERDTGQVDIEPSIQAGSPAFSLGHKIQRVPVSLREYEKLDLRHRRFDDMNANKATFVDCDFSYSVFDRAYFHAATFKNCKFIGSRFYDSNLRGASFPSCDFKYATFHRTLLEPREMIAVLPQEPNLKRDSLQNLRANAAEIGDFSSQREFVLAEIDAAVDHQSRALKGKEDYYRRKYSSFLDKARAAFTYMGLRFSGLLWGHGERPFRLVWSAAFFVVFLSLINLWAVVPKQGWEGTDAGLKVLKYGFDQFWDAGPDVNFRGFLLIDYILIGLRYLYTGLFISVMFKSISHR